MERTQKLQIDKIVNITSHRFSTVLNADRLLVLNNGQITKNGKHNVLNRQDGVYAELIKFRHEDKSEGILTTPSSEIGS